MPEANGHYKLASSLSPNSEHYAERIMELDAPDEPTELLPTKSCARR